MITQELQSAIYRFVLAAIEGERPHEQQKEELAHGLIAIAEANHVPIEHLVTWIRLHKATEKWTTAEFRRWAEAYDGLRAQVLAARSEEIV